MNDLGNALRPLRFGVTLSLLAILFGFGLGAAFGAVEEDLKGYLAAEGDAVLDSAYGGDAEKLKKVTDKAWVYFKRAHLHANGLGTSSLVLVLLLAVLPGAARLRSWTAAGLGAGAFGYGLYWLMAGMRAPGMGGTGAAKASLEWLAIPSSGLCIVGLVVVFVLSVRAFFGSRS